MDNSNSGKAVVKRPKLVKEKVGKDKYGSYINQYLCDYCGTPFEMTSSKVEYQLRNGIRVSCGCLSEHGVVSKMLVKLTGDVSVSPAEFSELMGPYVEYRQKLASVWRDMNFRCNSPKPKSYSRYGGRGIQVLFADFEHFFLWSVANGYGYKPGLQIDRIDNNADYHPTNCRWVDSRENNRNSSRTKLDPAKVKRVRELRASGAMVKGIAAEMGVSVRQVSSVLSGEYWGDVA